MDSFYSLSGLYIGDYCHPDKNCKNDDYLKFRFCQKLALKLENTKD